MELVQGAANLAFRPVNYLLVRLVNNYFITPVKYVVKYVSSPLTEEVNAKLNSLVASLITTNFVPSITTSITAIAAHTQNVPALSTGVVTIANDTRRIAGLDAKLDTVIAQLDPKAIAQQIAQNIVDTFFGRLETSIKKVMEETLQKYARNLSGIGQSTGRSSQAPERSGPATRGGAGAGNINVIKEGLIPDRSPGDQSPDTPLGVIFSKATNGRIPTPADVDAFVKALYGTYWDGVQQSEWIQLAGQFLHAQNVHETQNPLHTPFLSSLMALPHEFSMFSYKIYHAHSDAIYRNRQEEGPTTRGSSARSTGFCPPV